MPLLVAYLLTLQTIPNGAEHYYMIDVGETQIVLNTWGTLHATGYPLYVMLGNVLVTLLRGQGIDAATAPGVVSLLYTLAALGLLYALLRRVSGRSWLAAGVVALYGLTRTVWVHSSIAEIYSFGLLILMGLLALALWDAPVRGRLYWLALLGGVGVFHHRALLFAAPALVYAVWGELWGEEPHPKPLSMRERGLKTHAIQGVSDKASSSSQWGGWGVGILVRRLVLCGLIGMIGFLPYAYLPLRAQVGAAWVYGEPGTWGGFWDQFWGREAERFIGTPDTFEALLANVTLINNTLLTDLTAPGVAVGLLGLALGLRRRERRRAALTFLLSGAAAYLFHLFYYTDILSALILPVTLALAVGWLFAAEALVKSPHPLTPSPWGEGESKGRRFVLPGKRLLVPLVGLLLAVLLINAHFTFIRDLTTDYTGLETIEIAQGTPPDSTLMLDWGPRYFAVGFARDVEGTLSDVRLVSHKADFSAIVAGSSLLTPDFTFYNRPVAWWQEQIGAPVYLSAAAPHLVRISTNREMAEDYAGDGIQVHEASLDCLNAALELHVDWLAASAPERDYSVFVHLLDSSSTILTQGDQSAPVFGWRPTTSWAAGEIVHDVYTLTHKAGAALIRYGLYYQDASGAFVNQYVYEMQVQCDDATNS
ncbi:MAG: DUF2723 domain-containing protein [Anaerolineae bacterium]|nr:DUF2723 domain-containing protein [Anaerolineae bacterium]